MKEMISTCVAVVLMVAVNSKVAIYYDMSPIGDEYRGRYGFFLAAQITGFIVALVTCVIHSAQDPLLSAKTWDILNLVFCKVLFILCVLSGILMAKYVDLEIQIIKKMDPEKKSLLKLFFPNYELYLFLHVAATAFSFLSALFFLIDAIIQLPELR